MNIVLGVWRVARGMWFMVFLSIFFSGVLLVACLSHLIYGDGGSEVAGKFRLGS